MKPFTIFLAVFCQLFLVTGQIFFKRAMRQTPTPRPQARIYGELGLGIVSMSVWFFIWIGLLENENLSRVFPFEGLNPVLLVVASWLLLKERVSWNTGAGILLICAGICLASGS
ncbi:MAG TPA: EamA family transporter [Tepidisphaeraceae bacterium]|nr:EamA family transporter [Tepidisphaeraceae bacterium]